MRRPRRIILNTILSIIATGILAGCAAKLEQNIEFDSESGEVTPQVNLTFFGFKYEALNVMAIEESLHGFMDQYPEISISYDSLKSAQYFSVLEKRLATGNGDDIFMVDHERMLEFERQGKLADLSDLATLDNFSDLARSQMRASGTITYLPTSISAFGMYCNLDFLKEHGKEIPENWEQLEAVCDYFVSQGITPMVANNDISLKTVAIGKSMFPYYQNGDSAAALGCFNRGEADLAEAFRPGFELVEQMLDRGWVDRSEALATAKTKDDLALFAKGNRPFMLTGAWAVPRLRNLQPEFQFEVRPYPILEDGSVLVINVDTRISVNADSPHLEEAKRFVEYLTQSDNLWKFVNSQSSFSPLKENRLAQDTAIQSIGPYLTNQRSVIGSDDNLEIPIWDMTFLAVTEMLKGKDADAATAYMEDMLGR